MYIDDIKLFAKNEKELETLIQAERIYNQDIGMDLGKKMRYASFEKRKTTPSRRNGTIKKKSTNTWEYWKLTPSAFLKSKFMFVITFVKDYGKSVI